MGQTYQALLVLSPESEQNQGFLTGDQEVSAHRAAGHSDGTLRQRHLNDLHLHSTPHRRPAQEVAQQAHPDPGLFLRLVGDKRNVSSWKH